MHPHFPGPPLSVNISSQGRPTSLFVSWVVAEPGGFDYALCLRSLNTSGSPEGQQLQAHTNESNFEFHGLVPGSHYHLELTVLRPCWQNVTVNLTAQTGMKPVDRGGVVFLEAGAGGDHCSRGLVGDSGKPKGDNSKYGEPSV